MQKLIPRSDSSRRELAGMAAALVAFLLLIAKLLTDFRNGATDAGVWDRFGYLGLNNADLGGFLFIAAGFLSSFGFMGQRFTRLIVSFVAAVGLFLALVSIYGGGYVLVKGGSDVLRHSQYLLEDLPDAIIGLLFGYGALRLALPTLKKFRRTEVS